MKPGDWAIEVLREIEMVLDPDDFARSRQKIELAIWTIEFEADRTSDVFPTSEWI